MTTTYSRGHKIYWNGKDWRYVDDDSLYNDQRTCKRCGKLPTEGGYDACLGFIPGKSSACCGHGIEDKKIY